MIDEFDTHNLNRDVWLAHYLPAWSSLDSTKAQYKLSNSCLTLYISTDAQLWCADQHAEPLRVSGMQSGSYSGAVGTTLGQQSFRDGLQVSQEQPRFVGWVAASGKVEIRCRMRLSSRSMAALWLAGFEEKPDESGELCVVEVFGKSIVKNSVEIGMGIKSKNVPRLIDDFVAPRVAIDVSEFHTYSVVWDERSAVFSVDGQVVHTCPQSLSYPLQIMIGVFDFPNWSNGVDVAHVPSFDIDWVRAEGQ